MIDKGYRQLFHDAVAPTAILDRDFTYVDVSNLYERVLGQSREALIGRCVFDAFPDTVENETSLRQAWTDALAGKTSTIDNMHYPIPAADGDGMEDRWWAVHSGPVQFGDVPNSLLVFRVEDTTERVRMEQARELVTKELQHRMLNLTTLIGVIARQSSKSHTDVPTFVSEFLDRLTALSRSSRLLVTDDWAGLEMHDLVEDTLGAFNDSGHRITWSGPDVSLTAGAAQAIAMGLHELATNAVKYGALSVSGAAVSVRWSVDATGTLNFVWQEDMTGADAANAEAPEARSERTGFGTTMLRRLLPMQVNGAAEHGIVGAGMRYRLTGPVAQFGDVRPMSGSIRNTPQTLTAS